MVPVVKGSSIAMAECRMEAGLVTEHHLDPTATQHPLDTARLPTCTHRLRMAVVSHSSSRSMACLRKVLENHTASGAVAVTARLGQDADHFLGYGAPYGGYPNVPQQPQQPPQGGGSY
jgi:hypothetical protein